jgi:MSHA biogenesis protein MshL
MLKKIFLLTFLILTNCSYDKDANQSTFFDFKSKLQNKNNVTVIETPEMLMSDVILIPEKPSVIEDKLISISTTEEVPLIDMLLEISRVADVDIEIDPYIVGSMIITSKNKPLSEIFKRISAVNDIRFSEKDGVIFFEQDIPYVKTYIFDFLDTIRSGSGSISLETSVISERGGSSSSSLSSASSDEFWTSIESNIKQIIKSTELAYKYKADSARKLRGQEKSGESLSGGDYAINKRAGLITITASHKAHLEIAKYIEQLKRKSSAQVLIEMKFLEVNLNNNYQYGINWQALSLGSAVRQATITTFTAASNTKGLVFSGKNPTFDYVISILETFGTTRVLQSPRINAFNNQPAMLTFADNEVYFKLDVDIVPQQSGSGGVTIAERKTVKAEPQSIPIGIIMSVLPSIDLEKNEIILNVRPTVSYVKDYVSDPTAAWLNSNTTSGTTSTTVINQIPITVVRELDSLLKLPNGGIMVLGGFTKRDNKNSNTGIPFLSKIPILGWLFKYNKTDDVYQEMVILLKATIVNDSTVDKLYQFDKEIYNQFSEDPRDKFN